MEFNKYAKIGQFRNIISEIKHDCRFKGIDSDGEHIIDETIPLPTILFKGTVKLHGTNGGVSFNKAEGIKVQSRCKFISVGDDNYGFAAFVKKYESEFVRIFEKIFEENKLPLNTTLTLFGEWAGKGIQSGVGISKFEKAFYIFGLEANTGENSLELNYSNITSNIPLIRNIDVFDVHYININFNNPELSQDTLIELTNEVEKECPVSRVLGESNTVGEGFVWKGEFNNKVYRFKVKGQKHSNTKVKKLAEVDVESIQTMKEFAEYSVTDVRFEQGVKEVFGESKVNIKGLGKLISWIIEDILIEEEDTIVKNNINTKQIRSYLGDIIRFKFFNKLQ